MRGFAGALSILSALFVMVGLVSAQAPVSKQDSRGPVTVTATLLGPAAAGAPLRVKIVLDTHSVSLDAFAFESGVALRTSAGADLAPASVEGAKGGGHHREAVVVFSPSGATAPIRVVVKDVGGVKERVFTWDGEAGR